MLNINLINRSQKHAENKHIAIIVSDKKCLIESNQILIYRGRMLTGVFSRKKVNMTCFIKMNFISSAPAVNVYRIVCRRQHEIDTDKGKKIYSLQISSILTVTFE